MNVLEEAGALIVALICFVACIVLAVVMFVAAIEVAQFFYNAASGVPYVVNFY